MKHQASPENIQQTAVVRNIPFRHKNMTDILAECHKRTNFVDIINHSMRPHATTPTEGTTEKERAPYS